MSLVETRCVGVAMFVRLNRPERANALNTELVEELIVAVDQACASGARVLVLQGVGKSFCGGFDLTGLDEESDASLAYRFLRIEALLQRLYYAPLYTVALAHGAVSGAGSDLVASCAYRIAAPQTTFIFPGSRFGVVLGTNRLLQLVGQRGRRLVAEQQRLGTEEAERIGLIDSVQTPDDWEEIVAKTCHRIEQLPESTLARVMRLDEMAGDRDLGILARSVLEPGLKQRVSDYWNRVQQARKSN